MRVESLELSDFRSYPAAMLELPPGPSALLGLNGQGKTNLIEAIGYVASLGSHRVSTDAPLVRLGAERAVIRAGIVREDRRALVEIEINPGRANRVQLNRNAVTRPRQVLGVLNTVLFWLIPVLCERGPVKQWLRNLVLNNGFLQFAC